MPAEGFEPADVDAIVAELRARVERRREEGDFPTELDADLDRHWRGIAAALPSSRLETLARRLDAAADFGRHRIYMDSSVPLGGQVHRLVARAVTRQTDGLLRQMREFAEVTRDMLEALIDVLPDRGGEQAATMVRVLARLDAVEDELGSARRAAAAAGDDGALPALAARVESLERAAILQGYRPWYRSGAFESAFRGSRDEILASYRPLVARFAGCAPVIDVGCGRGEVLELLAELGVEARGVDLDADLVAGCAARGLDAVAGDAIAHLEALPDHSLGGVFSAQVVEHLQPQQLLDLVAAASQKLRSGGLIVLETVNPQSLYVYAHAYPIDPTHVRPVAPLYLEFLLREAGFKEIHIEWRSPVGDEDRIEPLGLGEAPGPDREALARNLDRLQRLLFADQDYAVIASR